MEKEKQQKEKNVLEITALGPAHAEMDGRRTVFWPMTIVAFNTQRIERSIYELSPASPVEMSIRRRH